MVHRISIIPPAGSIAARDQRANAAQARTGRPTAERPTGAQADAAGAPVLGQRPVQAPDAGAQARQAQSQRQRILAGLRATLGCASASAVPVALTPEQTIEAWQSWSQRRHPETTERRQVAAQRVIESILGNSDNPYSLDLKGLGLKGALPPPAGSPDPRQHFAQPRHHNLGFDSSVLDPTERGTLRTAATSPISRGQSA